MCKEIEKNWKWFDKAMTVSLSWKDTNLTDWFKKQYFKNVAPDEVSLYALNVLLEPHSCI